MTKHSWLGVRFSRERHEQIGDDGCIAKIMSEYDLQDGSSFQIQYWKPVEDESWTPDNAMIQCGKYDHWTEIAFITLWKRSES